MKIPIGVFDSGFGGLTVLKALRRELPEEDFIYLGDTARVPYGTRSPETVREYARDAATLLLKKGVKAIVVACNTVTTWAMGDIRELCGEAFPLVGVVEPGILEALRATRNGHILITGTPSTIRGASHEKGLRALRPDIKISSVACPVFVSIAEEGWQGDIPDLVAERYLSRFKDSEPDTLILGCTHFPLLSGSIQKVLPGITQVDPACHTATDTRRALTESGLLAFEGDRAGKVLYLVTDAPARFIEIGSRLVGENLEDVELVHTEGA